MIRTEILGCFKALEHSAQNSKEESLIFHALTSKKDISNIIGTKISDRAHIHDLVGSEPSIRLENWDLGFF